MKSRWIARFVAGFALLAVTGLTAPIVAGAKGTPAAPAPTNFYFLDLPASGAIGPDPSGPFANIPPTWLGVTSFSWGPDLSPEKDRAGSLTVSGFDVPSAQQLLVAVGNRVIVHAMRLVVTQANAAGQQVPAEVIVVKDAIITVPTGKNAGSPTGAKFIFNYDEASYQYSVPDGSGGLKWIPDPTKPTMTTVRPIVS